MPLLITAGASGWESFARRCPFSGGMVAASPYQDVEYIAVLIDRPPQVMTLAVDGDEDFVEEPRIAWPFLAAAQGSSVGAPELETPLPDRLVTDDDATFGEEILGIPEAEAEPMVEPDGVSDDLVMFQNSIVMYDMHP